MDLGPDETVLIVWERWTENMLLQIRHEELNLFRWESPTHIMTLFRF
jgi:hypothetical protein